MIAYLIMGFTLAGIMTVFTKTDSKEETTDAITLAYIVIIAWPVLLPLFMVAGVVCLKKDSATRESK